MKRINNIKYNAYLIVYTLIILSFSVADLQAEGLEWPRELVIDSGLLTIYQPQVDNLENDVLKFRAAVSYKAAGSDGPVFGATWLESRVEIDREERMVHILDLVVTDTRFPEGSEHVKAEFAEAIRKGLPGWRVDFSLDDLLTSLEASEELIAAANDLNMDPPEIIYRDHPALLVMIDGDPVLREIENSSYKAVINTPYPLIVDAGRNSYYLNAGKDVWYRASEVTGPFAYLVNPPSDIAGMVDQSEMEDSDEVVTASNAPEIVVRTKPAELLVTEGEAKFEPLVDDLLVISNSASDVFMHVSEQKYFIVLSGRWYTSASMQGPWEYIRSDDLPVAFQKIPADSGQADSRVYVAGTDEAREAVMDAQIPQTAAISKGRVDIEVTYDGAPRFTAVKGLDLEYAENTGSTVLKSGQQYFLVEDAVWYVASSPTGPWDVAENRPDDVDSIPPESPVYNVKYVYIYETTPEVVYVGYTPGYTGSYVYHTTIVYGTGWYYRPWVSPYYYYPRYATWGFHVTYNPWTGWGFGLSWGWGPFRVGFHTGGYWHRHHHWHHHHHHGRWGPGGYRPHPVRIDNRRAGIDNKKLAVRDKNLYRDRDQAARVRDTRDTPMNRDARDRVSDRSAGVNTGAARDKAATTRQNNVFADKQGNVYRNTDNGWQKRDSGAWSNTKPATGAAETRPASPATSVQDRSYQPSTRQSPAYSSSNSGYNRPSSLDRQQYSRQRSSSRDMQYQQQRSTQTRARPAGRRR